MEVNPAKEVIPVKIVIFELEDWEREAFSHLTDEHDVALRSAPLSKETAGEHAGAEVISTFLNSDLDRAVLEQIPDLQLIATRSTGFDHIDKDYCSRSGVTVSNVPT